MELHGSCHCGAVRFSLRSRHAVPYQRCYCSICRKTQGGGGYAINLGGEAASLRVEGSAQVRVYRAKIRNPEDHRARQSTGERHFCGVCGSALWVFDPRWPELVHPFASAIDTELPVPPAHTHLMLDFKPAWVEVEKHAGDKIFARYPDESLAEWHERHGLSG